MDTCRVRAWVFLVLLWQDGYFAQFPTQLMWVESLEALFGAVGVCVCETPCLKCSLVQRQVCDETHAGGYVRAWGVRGGKVGRTGRSIHAPALISMEICLRVDTLSASPWLLTSRRGFMLVATGGGPVTARLWTCWGVRLAPFLHFTCQKLDPSHTHLVWSVSKTVNIQAVILWPYTFELDSYCHSRFWTIWIVTSRFLSWYTFSCFGQ